MKQRLQTGMYKSTQEAILLLYKENGMLGFWAKDGLMAQIFRDVPYAVITLLTYEGLRSICIQKKKQSYIENMNTLNNVSKAEMDSYLGDKSNFKPTDVENLLIGAIAGGIGTFSSNPMDVIKTRIMTQPEVYKTVLMTARKTMV